MFITSIVFRINAAPAAVATTTTLTPGTSTALAASNTHAHHHNMHLLSKYTNHLTGNNSINSIGSRNDDIPTGWVSVFSTTQYGSTVSHSYHHLIPTGTIADINGANRVNDVNADFPTGWAFSN